MGTAMRTSLATAKLDPRDLAPFACVRSAGLPALEHYFCRDPGPRPAGRLKGVPFLIEKGGALSFP